MNNNILIKNANIVDGSGNTPEVKDVLIRNDLIEKIGIIEKFEGCEIIEGKDFFLSPGFIDIHGHSEISILVEPLTLSKIMQGITTEVVDNCGTSAAPV